MEHYFDAAKAFVLAESTRNQTVISVTDEPGITSSTWPLTNDDSYEHERYMQLTMLFLVLFFLVRKLLKAFKKAKIISIHGENSKIILVGFSPAKYFQ